MLTWEMILEFAKKENPEPPKKVIKSDTEWQNILSPNQFKIMRLKATERPFSGEFCSVYDEGVYSCAACNTELFISNDKFDSKSGWPSFTQPISKNIIRYVLDKSHGMTRIETICNVCDSHLGHVFPDGPPPSRLRYCINSAALVKVKG